jgi:hypothetical protein
MDDFVVSESSMCARCNPGDEEGKSRNCSQCIRTEEFKTPLRRPTKSDEPPALARPKYSRGKGASALSAIAKANNIISCIFWEDRRSCPNASCMACKQPSCTIYFAQFALCRQCEMLCVGIPLSHPKLTLIVNLRKEINDLDLKLALIANAKDPNRNQSAFLEITRRKDQIDRVLYDLIKIE